MARSVRSLRCIGSEWQSKAPSFATGLNLREIGEGNLSFRSLGGFYEHEAARAALVHELDSAGDLGEERVVFPAANVCAGLNTGAALADDDGAAGNKLSAECFYAKPLRVGVAAISGTA